MAALVPQRTATISAAGARTGNATAASLRASTSEQPEQRSTAVLSTDDRRKLTAEFERVRALKNKQNQATYCKYLEPVLIKDVAGETVDLKLQCKLCEVQFSWKNPSRLSGTHFGKGGACKKIHECDDLT
jgi:hypothetical protein